MSITSASDQIRYIRYIRFPYHERKRAYPFNLCYLCSRKRIRNRLIRFI